MNSHQLIDAQFDRAVEIVQSLPKNGPIQTGYEEKLTMYSLYKQATVGNVNSPRPNIFDMLGRAKWDEWAKRKDLDPYEAKWTYVDALMKVLRRYSEKTVARELLRDLESYGGDSGNLVLSHSPFTKPGSTSSGSTTSERLVPVPHLEDPPHEPHDIAHEETDEISGAEDERQDEARDLPGPSQPYPRPQSSTSSHRYRTPMASMMATSPPIPMAGVPETQPLPMFETPSAFAESYSVNPSVSSYVGQYSELSGAEVAGSPHIYPAHPKYPGNAAIGARQYDVPGQPASLPSIERALEDVQAHLAAVTERLDSLESVNGQYPRSSLLLSRSSIHRAHDGRQGLGPADRADGERREWDFDDLGMWALVLNPVARGVRVLRDVAVFFVRNESRSPALIVVRRLCLDISFIICVLAVIRALWRNSVVRRREVKVALLVLWRAIVGTKKERTMVDRGV